jgi:DNA-binding GntR family transcriptional regulator
MAQVPGAQETTPAPASSDDEGPDETVFALGPRRTVEEVVAAKLREAILAGSLRPGDRLAYRDLAHRFGVSVTPVRIALRELSNEGLVEMRPHTGARVTPLSVDEIEDIFATRIGIEGWLARHAAESLDEQTIAAMAHHFEGLKRAQEEGETELYLQHSRALRATCYAAAERPRLFDRFEALYEHSRRYVFLLIADPGRLERSRTDMAEFFDACAARDGPRAQQAIQKALETTLSYLSQAFRHASQDAVE